MKKFVRDNILQWHRDQRDRAVASARNTDLSDEKRADAERSAKRHAEIIEGMLTDG